MDEKVVPVNDLKKGAVLIGKYGDRHILFDNKKGLIRCVKQSDGYILGDRYIFNYSEAEVDGETVKIGLSKKQVDQAVNIAVMGFGERTVNEIKLMLLPQA